MVAAIQLEWCVTGACIFGVIVRKLGHRQESYPVILFEVDKSSKVFLYRAVLSFCLPVCLSVKRGGESSLDTKEVAERGPELGRKNRSAVTDNGVWEAVMSHHYINNYFRKSWGINGDLDWLIIYHFCGPVNND